MLNTKKKKDMDEAKVNVGVAGGKAHRTRAELKQICGGAAGFDLGPQSLNYELPLCQALAVRGVVADIKCRHIK